MFFLKLRITLRKGIFSSFFLGYPVSGCLLRYTNRKDHGIIFNLRFKIETS